MIHREPTDYLNADNFATIDDESTELKYRQGIYRLGLHIGKDSLYVFINNDGTYGAYLKSDVVTNPGKILGEVCCDRYFWQGILDSGVPIVVYRCEPIYIRGNIDVNRI